MFRGTAARTVLALLAAALLALPFFAPATSFASAHTFGQAEAKTATGTMRSGGMPRDERATVRDCGPTGNPTGPLHNRDRHRSVDSGPEAPERPAPGQDSEAAREPAAPGAAHARTPRPSAGRTPAALQVFRC
ncbi:hypothetical protein ACH4UM_08375 [Streptomyces sp. NPDC020801]|uniref:hypothetical protein n=1 Tax=unclassified Streptomyces TaxID=2593676 RepID=UPI003793FC9F